MLFVFFTSFMRMMEHHRPVYSSFYADCIPTEYASLLDYDTEYIVIQVPTFRKNLLLPSSRTTLKMVAAGSSQELAPMYQLQSITSHNTGIFINTAVSSNFPHKSCLRGKLQTPTSRIKCEVIIHHASRVDMIHM
jgi:hypothetical protein